jgi:GMP synthase-like glutamine amidotransferase
LLNVSIPKSSFLIRAWSGKTLDGRYQMMKKAKVVTGICAGESRVAHSETWSFESSRTFEIGRKHVPRDDLPEIRQSTTPFGFPARLVRGWRPSCRRCVR